MRVTAREPEARSSERPLDFRRGSRSDLPRDVGLGSHGSPRALRDAGPAWRRADARRLRRGHPAPAPAVHDRADRAPRGVPHALPRGSLPRPAGDAEDVRAPQPRAPAHGLRASGARAISSAPCSGSSGSSATPWSWSSSATATSSTAGTTASSPSRSPTASPPTATRSSSFRAPAASTSRRRGRSESPRGRSSAVCRRARRSQLPDGGEVRPEQVLGPPRPGRQGRVRRRYGTGRQRARGRQGRRRPRPRGHLRRGGAGARRRDRSLDRRRRSRARGRRGRAHARPDAPLQPLLRARDRARGARGLPGDGGSQGLRYHRRPVPGAGRPPTHQGRSESDPRGGRAT